MKSVYELTEDEKKICVIINKLWEDEEKYDLVWHMVRDDSFELLFEEFNINSEEVDVNYLCTPSGYTVLMGRVEANDFEGCKAYLNRGAEVDFTSYENYTALNLAAKYNFADIAELLIEHGANVNYEGSATWSYTPWVIDVMNQEKGESYPYKGYRPLLHAIINNAKETAELLLKHGATIHKEGFVEDKYGGEYKRFSNDALMAAIETGSKELVELLIKYGADRRKLS